tara:strand:+ start:203 stop:709 length:507 start_codon:yes stop_codon:yes gene_type:complete
MKISKENQLMKGIFLLLLAVVGNFIAEMMGCHTRKLLENNMIVKHIVTFIILYFAIDFTTTDVVNPTDNLILSVKIYILFVLFTRMNLKFTIVTFILLAIAYKMNAYIDYYKSTKKEHKNLIKIRNYLYNLIILLLVIGSVYYYYEQYNSKKNFSLSKHFIGVINCKY